MTEQDIKQALETVADPQTGQSVVARGMVKDLKLEGNTVSFTLEVSSGHTIDKAQLNFSCMEAITRRFPQADVNVHFLNKAITPGEVESAVPHIKNVIAVASGKGGVGKSTVAINLALGLRQLGAKTGLMDADVYGPSLPTMMGLAGQKPKIKEVGGKMKIVPLEAHGLPTISIGNMIEPEQAVVLRGPRLAAIIRQFFNDVMWPELDFLIVDLPPGTGDVQLTLVQTVPVTGVVLVTTPQEVAIADAIKAMNMFMLPQIGVPILGVVENMAWFTPEELPNNRYYLFGQGGGKRLALESRSMLLGQVPLVQGIREGGDNGYPAVLSGGLVGEAFVKVAENTLRQIAVRNEMLEPTRVVHLNE